MNTENINRNERDIKFLQKERFQLIKLIKETDRQIALKIMRNRILKNRGIENGY